MTKRCSKCMKTKPADQFFRRVASSDGLSVICKACQKEVSRDYYERKRNAEPNRWKEGERDKGFAIDMETVKREILELWDSNPLVTLRTTSDVFFMAQQEEQLCPHLKAIFIHRGRRLTLYTIRKVLDYHIPGIKPTGSHTNPLYVRATA